MKSFRLFLSIFFTFFYFSTFALNESCFEYLWTLEVPQNKIFLLNIDRNIDYAKTENNDIYLKLYKSSVDKLDYLVDIKQNELLYLKDWKYDTYFTKTLWENSNDLILDFWKSVWPWISPKILIDSINYTYNIFISDDNISYKKVSLYNLDTFSFRYLKLSFFSYNRDRIIENIKIRELDFKKNNYIYLVKSDTNWKIKLFSNFFCSNWKDYDDLRDYQSKNFKSVKSYVFNSSLDIFSVNLIKNIDYQVDIWNDVDLDWVTDSDDNCKNDYNPNQLDTNTNWIWDLCDDDDKDWLVWKNDNCPYISNRDQKDINNNWIWDVCEFDKDGDAIFDSQDNCINIYNPDQLDDDRDGIWNACDNCKLYNPNQLDKNDNGIWDVCEETERYKIDNDRDKDSVIDSQDNCVNVYNPDQKDNDRDLVWDVCDNCINIKNFDQLDLDKNWVWDMCEDSDKDWIIWYLDNCINDANNDQKDSDNNGIGNVCEDTDRDNIINWKDNCPYDYNPDQKDIDNDSIWDICDEKDDRFIESNKWFFIWLIVFIVLLFLGWIFMMLWKINKVSK